MSFVQLDLPDLLLDKLHPDRVHFVQRSELAAFVPPFGREPGEMLDLRRVYGVDIARDAPDARPNGHDTARKSGGTDGPLD